MRKVGWFCLLAVVAGGGRSIVDETQAKPETSFDPDVDFTGTWENQRESTMALEMDKATGKLKGTYTTKVGSSGGTLSAPIVGQAHGDQLVFYVDWKPYSMTTWAGQLLTTKNGKEILETVWLNTVNIKPEEEPNMGWSAIRTGGDSFTKK